MRSAASSTTNTATTPTDDQRISHDDVHRGLTHRRLRTRRRAGGAALLALADAALLLDPAPASADFDGRVATRGASMCNAAASRSRSRSMRELAVLQLRAALGRDDAHARPEPLDQPGPLARAERRPTPRCRRAARPACSTCSACWPPGPPDELNRHSSSSAAITQVRVMRRRSGTAKPKGPRLAISAIRISLDKYPDPEYSESVAKAGRANPLALAVLACLYERPMHPYEVAQTLRSRAKHESIRLNFGSLYGVVEQLEKPRLRRAPARPCAKAGARSGRSTRSPTPGRAS